MADALTVGATYSRPKGGRVPSPWSTCPPSSLLAALFSHILMQRGLRFAPSLRALGFHNVLWPRQASLTYLPWRGPSLCALSALRWVVGDATMSTPGGEGTRLRIAFLKLTRARPTGFYHRVGAPRLQG